MHLRCGDAADQGRAANVRMYVEWLKGIWPALQDPILFLASDKLGAVRGDFAEFHPVTSEQVRMPIPNAGFYPDFHVMTQADILAAGNSSFSFAASMLNSRAKVFMRPNESHDGLIPFDPWSSLPVV
jgi:hypothetical protein